MIRGPGVGVGFDGGVVGVEVGLKKDQGGDAADHVGDVFGFLHGEAATEERFLAIAEPLLNDLIAADGVVPDGARGVGPIGDVIGEKVARAEVEGEVVGVPDDTGQHIKCGSLTGGDCIVD